MNQILSFIFLFLVFELLPLTSSADSEYSPKNSLNCKCRLGAAKRIIGGGKASKNFIPWMVSFAVKNNHYCGVSEKRENLDF